jgi:hypothetical protein
MQTFPDPYILRLVLRVNKKSMALIPCILRILGIDAGVNDPEVYFEEINGI